jgi:hypothetical protein
MLVPTAKISSLPRRFLRERPSQEGPGVTIMRAAVRGDSAISP